MKNTKKRMEEVLAAFEKAGFTTDYSISGTKITGFVYQGGCEAAIEYDSRRDEEYVWVDCLETDPESRGNGAATAVLNLAFEISDELVIPVLLEAVPIGTNIRMTLDQLVSWYEKRGFALVKRNSSSCDMKRDVRVRAVA